MKLIMFKGGVETLEYFSIEMAEYWSDKGYEIFWYDLLVGESEAKRLCKFIIQNKKDKFIAFTFNHEGLAGEDGIYWRNNDFTSDSVWNGYDIKVKNIRDEQNKKFKNIWDEYNIKVINMVVDHPLYYHKYHRFLPKDYYQINIDRKHVEYMRHFYPEIKNVFFLPTAGMFLNKNYDILPDMNYLPMNKRPYDIVFTGNFTPKSILRKNIEEMGQDYVDFYENVLDEMIDNPNMSIEEIGHKCLKIEIPKITKKEITEVFPTFMYVDLAVRFHYRELIIKALAECGFKITTVGEGFEFMNIDNKANLNNLGGGNTDKCLKCINQGKISLNIMPWFKDGAHDRIFTSMLNGAVLLTDSSKYLDEKVLRNDNSYRYNLSMLREYERSGFDISVLKDFKENVSDLLADDEKLSKMADIAFVDANPIHTWQNRAEQIEKDFF